MHVEQACTHQHSFALQPHWVVVAELVDHQRSPRVPAIANGHKAGEHMIQRRQMMRQRQCAASGMLVGERQ
jgi:hypothetical protein